ncbi:MAG TPA: DUF4287 domain-containing protein [Erysipelotrichaceae bacterium]|nr:DUF4287 domain-containing protein [Erysipelotrichaceae bacterium]
MSFQAYIDNIKKITNLTPEQIRVKAIEQGILTENMKATVLTDWLKREFNLGHGHAMSMWKYFIDHDWVQTKHTKL